MIETPNREIDVDALMAEIRAEVLQARRAPADAAAPARSAPADAGDPGWALLIDHVALAERNAPVGLEVPAFVRYVGAKRRLARFAARAVLFVSQVVTMPQRSFNSASVAALRMLAERVRALEAEVAALRATARAGRADAMGEGEPRP